MVNVVVPGLEYQDAFLRMLDDYDTNDPENGSSYALARTSFKHYFRALHDEEEGFNLPIGFVPCSHRWLVDGEGNIAAIARIRHSIDTPFLSSVGGHIGYDVPPSQRGKRYAIAALQAALVEAYSLGLERVLVCADASNVASCRTIERCGGVLEMEFMSEHWPTPVRRYWIATQK